jgi:hypothetical protein
MERLLAGLSCCFHEVGLCTVTPLSLPLLLKGERNSKIKGAWKLSDNLLQEALAQEL